MIQSCSASDTAIWGGMTGTEETLAVNNKEVMYYHYHIVMVSIARI
jgi:hypothetical protein